MTTPPSPDEENGVETCDVHLYNLKKDDSVKPADDVYKTKRYLGPKGPEGFARVPNKDVFVFRMGFFEQFKLNIESMIEKSEAGKWYSVDIILDWSQQFAGLYID